MENYIDKADEYEHTRGAHDLIGKRVLAKSGAVQGRVKEIRLNDKTSNFEGVLVKRRFKSTQYFCKTYIERVTAKAILLSIEPVSQYLKRTVISADGKRIGTVKSIARNDNTNNIRSIIVSIGWTRTTSILAKDIKLLGNSIILKKAYAEIKHDRKK